MKRLLGAVLLLLGSWQTGRCFYTRKRDELERVERLLELLRELECEIVRLETPLPQLLSRMEQVETLCPTDYAPLPAGDFSARWRHFTSALAVSEEVQAAMKEMGLSLCRSQEPEKVFFSVGQKLERNRTELERCCAERKRLAPALGACGGALLVLMLW